MSAKGGNRLTPDLFAPCWRQERRQQLEDAKLREALDVIRDRATRSNDREQTLSYKRLAGSFKKIMEL